MIETKSNDNYWLAVNAQKLTEFCHRETPTDS